MLDIAPFIRDLILLNECIILRGVGGFETSYRHACFDNNKKMILPPGKTITFREDLVKDNGVLAEHMAESLKITVNKANEHIDDYVKDLYNKLNENEKFKSEGLGTFSMSDKGVVEFTPEEGENYLADSFGLDTLTISTDEITETTLESSMSSPGIQQGRRLTGLYVTLGILVLLISVTVLVLISGKGDFSILGFSFFSSDTTNEEVIVFGGREEIMEDSLMQSIEKVLDDKTDTKTALTPDMGISDAQPESIYSYNLIAGSFRSERNAEILKAQLLRKGFSPNIILTSDGHYRVVIGSYSDKENAMEELRRIRIQLDQSVWLLEGRENY